MTSSTALQLSPTSTAIDIFQKRGEIRRKEQDEYDKILEYLNDASKKPKVVPIFNNNKKKTNSKKVTPTKGYLYVVGDNCDLRLGTPQDYLW